METEISWVEVEMSWEEVGEARWSWVHGLVIPTLNFELILPRKICHQVLLVTSSLGGKFL